jgi:hypothetical protein
MHYAMQGEYSGFFDIGMVQRNEKNAIIVHGTMCLMRRCRARCRRQLVERHDLRGHRSGPHHDRARLAGALHQPPLWLRPPPESFEAFKKQRHRWAYGGVQIVKKHWRRFLPGVSSLSREQRREFHAWLAGLARRGIAWRGGRDPQPRLGSGRRVRGHCDPDKVLTIPIIAAFAVAVFHFVTLYRLRVPINKKQTLGAVIAAMSVQWTVARAVGDGLIKEHLPFTRTAKGGRGKMMPVEFHAFWEAVLGGLLVLGAIVVLAFNTDGIQELTIFAVVLMLQSLPFLSAASLAAIEGSRLNEFATWRELQTKALVPLAEACGRHGGSHRTGRKAAGNDPVVADFVSRCFKGLVSGPALLHFALIRRVLSQASRTQYDDPIGMTSSLKL